LAAREQRLAWRTFSVALAFTVPLLVATMALPYWPRANDWLHANLLPAAAPGYLPLAGAVGFALATPVQFGPGGVFYVRAWAALKHGGTNMEVLIALGTSVSYLYSLGHVLAAAMGWTRAGGRYNTYGLVNCVYL
jgi:Cu+-exporting ATPase